METPAAELLSKPWRDPAIHPAEHVDYAYSVENCVYQRSTSGASDGDVELRSDLDLTLLELTLSSSSWFDPATINQ
jgi:hypothetical protein